MSDAALRLAQTPRTAKAEQDSWVISGYEQLRQFFVVQMQLLERELNALLAEKERLQGESELLTKAARATREREDSLRRELAQERLDNAAIDVSLKEPR